MINIQALTEKDLKRKVIYEAFKGAKKEEGLITSYNENYIFVDYQNVGRGQATPPSKLKFI